MEHRRISDEVLYPQGLSVGLKLLDMAFLKAQALKNPRKRIRFCTHQDEQDSLHEMFIVHGKDAYVRPHRHLNKTESFYLIEGEADIVLFNEDGQITEKRQMGTVGSGKQFYYRLAQGIYHTLIIKSETISFFEVTSGPFKKEDTQFPSWAPDGKDEAVAKKYMQELADKVVSCA